MNFSEPFIRRPVMTAVLTASVVLFGALAYRRLPVNDLPVVDYPVIQVFAAYPGASPETVAANIATPLERSFMQINGLELVTSQSTQGFVTLTLQFALSKSIDAAATDVQTAISQSTGSLPIDMPSPPTFSKSNPNDQPIMYIALTSDSVTSGQIYDYATTQVGQRISILPGVSKVNVYGSKSAIRIKADPSAMWARKISVDDLAAAVKAGTSYSGAGQLDSPSGTSVLRPQGQLDTPEGYSNLIVGSARRLAGLPARRGRGAPVGRERAPEHAVLGPRVPDSVGHGRPGGQPPGRRQRRRGLPEHPGDPADHPDADPGIRADHDDLRPLPIDRPLRHRRPGDAPDRVRPRRRRHLPLPRPRDGHVDSRRGAAALASADLRRDEHAGLQPRQPLAHGADPGDRVPDRRRDRVPGEHRPPHGARREGAGRRPSGAPRRSASRSCR